MLSLHYRESKSSRVHNLSLFVGNPRNGIHPVEFQAALRVALRQRPVPDDLYNALYSLGKIADSYKLNLEDLTVYALESCGILPSEATDIVTGGEFTQCTSSNSCGQELRLYELTGYHLSRFARCARRLERQDFLLSASVNRDPLLFSAYPIRFSPFDTTCLRTYTPQTPNPCGMPGLFLRDDYTGTVEYCNRLCAGFFPGEDVMALQFRRAFTGLMLYYAEINETKPMLQEIVSFYQSPGLLRSLAFILDVHGACLSSFCYYSLLRTLQDFSNCDPALREFFIRYALAAFVLAEPEDSDPWERFRLALYNAQFQIAEA
jgi:hypothetical protein